MGVSYWTLCVQVSLSKCATRTHTHTPHQNLSQPPAPLKFLLTFKPDDWYEDRGLRRRQLMLGWAPPEIGAVRKLTTFGADGNTVSYDLWDAPMSGKQAG